MFSMVDLIIMVVVISFCTSAIVGTLVYYLLKKKHDEDVDWLCKIIRELETKVSSFRDKYAGQIAEYHKQED